MHAAMNTSGSSKMNFIIVTDDYISRHPGGRQTPKVRLSGTDASIRTAATRPPSSDYRMPLRWQAGSIRKSVGCCGSRKSYDFLNKTTITPPTAATLAFLSTGGFGAISRAGRASHFSASDDDSGFTSIMRTQYSLADKMD